MFPVSSIGNDISSDLVRRKMNDIPGTKHFSCETDT